MRKKTGMQPVVHSLEERIAPGTFTLVNKSASTVYIEFVRHDPAISGQLGDGTSFGAPTPAATELNGSYAIQAGTVRTFDSGDSTFVARLANSSGKTFGFSNKAPSQYTNLTAGYDIKLVDGSSTVSVQVGGHNYGTLPYSSLGGSKGKSLGIKLTGGFYRFANNQEVTIPGPRQIAGTSTQSFSDHSGNTEYNRTVYHVFKPPTGTHVTSYTTDVTSARGDSVRFFLAKGGSSVVETGTISGGGLFSYGGSYAGTVTLHYAY